MRGHPQRDYRFYGGMKNSSVMIKNTSFFWSVNLSSLHWETDLHSKTLRVKGLAEAALVSSFKGTPCRVPLGRL